MATTSAYDKVSTFSHIHNDIALSILSKLPLKSLTRFTCVQKSWSLLFRNPHFMDMFRTYFISKHDEDNDKDKPCLLLNERTLSTTGDTIVQDTLYAVLGESFENRVRLDWPPPLQDNDSFIDILSCACVNGILCLSRGFDDHINIVLWNPMTEEFKVVPHSHLPYENMGSNPPPFAFGYDRVKDDYKVIRIAPYPKYFEDNWVLLPEKESPFWKMKGNDQYPSWNEIRLDMYDLFWELYSLRSNSWRKLVGFDHKPVSKLGHGQVNLNEFCHWLGRNNDMVSFDFSNEIFFVTTLPSFDFSNETPFERMFSISDLERRKLDRNLLVLNGSVAFICTAFKTACLHIWVLGELGVRESWTKLFVIGPLPFNMRPISVGIKSIIFFLKENGNRACFDLSTQRVEEVWVKGNRFRLQIIIYKENLISLVK